MEIQRRKAYVSVNLDVDSEGNIFPRMIRWEDGHTFEIDKVKRKCRTAAKVGGFGIRYTVLICGKEAYLFHESGSDKWFVEAKEGWR